MASFPKVVYIDGANVMWAYGATVARLHRRANPQALSKGLTMALDAHVWERLGLEAKAVVPIDYVQGPLWCIADGVPRHAARASQAIDVSKLDQLAGDVVEIVEQDVYRNLVLDRLIRSGRAIPVARPETVLWDKDASRPRTPKRGNQRSGVRLTRKDRRLLKKMATTAALQQQLSAGRGADDALLLREAEAAGNAWIVSNDNFRDHRRLRRQSGQSRLGWLSDRRIPFAFEVSGASSPAPPESAADITFQIQPPSAWVDFLRTV